MAGEAEEMEELSPAEFASFFEEVHGYQPFPWQQALLTRVFERGWPALIDVPTGLGKTAVLDVAVFLSALRSVHARRRVFLVVDRRLIVDQAHDEAEKVRRALENPPEGSVRARVRARLRIPGDEPASVLDVTRMRGGVNWSWLWIERPDRPAIVTGTVDQIGSRLLFRGYGVGERLRPIDAAMVGTDSLILIDEAHLSDPFFTTLRDVLAASNGVVSRTPVVVAMSASPANSNGEAHGITAADADHSVAGKRLRASKSLHPVEVKATVAKAATEVADALAAWALRLGAPGKVVGVVANTVSIARTAFERIRDATSPEQCVLLTGRIRPIDREYLLASWLPRIRAGAVRNADAELYVVATQTIEAGADIDLDDMVTQAASLSALVQRLGRVNRMGARAGARVIVVHAGKLMDPVYGRATEETWEWLTDQADPLAHKAGRSEQDLGTGLEVSPAALTELLGRIAPAQRTLMERDKPYVPVITRSILETWARTSPAPHPDIPVAAYLHGIDAGEPTVSVVWRADLQGDNPLGWMPSVTRIPPTADEAIELPISAVRRWLREQPTKAPPQGKRADAETAEADISDLESQGTDDAKEPIGLHKAGFRVLRYCGADESRSATPDEIRPGDFVVVPSGWGGCDCYGWNPSSTRPVTDLADLTGWRGRRTAGIRIGPALSTIMQALDPALKEPMEELVAQVKADIDSDATNDLRYRDMLRNAISGQELRLPHQIVLSRLSRAGHLVEFEGDMREGDVNTQVAALFAVAGSSWNEDDSAAGTSVTPERKPLGLTAHQEAVGRRAGEFAANAGLPPALKRAVERAGCFHDEGKRDPRFQVMLHGGDRWRARVAPEPLAKSGMDPVDRAAFRRAADLSGYPRRMRHEALSARIAADLLRQSPADELDTDLVVHLVASHHGFARPMLPPVSDPAPEKVHVPVGDAGAKVFVTSATVDWEGPTRFSELCDRYGYWGLALLESIVRLADIWCSARSEGCDGHS